MKYDNLHPNDIRLFKTVCDAMTHVAKSYQLPLKSIEGFPNPEYRTAPLGDCSGDGCVRLTLRGMIDGVWDVEPRREQDVWNTAAHELAHLRHMNHGVAFQEFELEMQQAMNNRKEDYAAKVLEKLVKLQKHRESAAEMGSEAEAEAFAGMINKMLIENELNPSDIDYARGLDRDPVIEIFCDLNKYPVKGETGAKKSRVAWQETLAGVVAKGHLCHFLIRLGTNDIVFVGTKSHATVAEYCYGTLVASATRMSLDARVRYHRELQRRGGNPKEGRGFRESWLVAFVNRIDVRLKEARKAAVREVSSDINTQSQALMRLDGALIKAQNYIDDKFGRKRRYASALNGGKETHAVGAAMGRAAADSLPIGRRGVEGNSQRRLG